MVPEYEEFLPVSSSSNC